jgi:sulfate adenylyltransferase
MTANIAPHGGTLINRIARGHEREELARKAATLTRVPLTPREISDLEMIAIGALSPLTGFMGHDDYNQVVDTMHLTSGLAWSLPVTLAVADGLADGLAEGQEVALEGDGGALLAVMTVTDKFRRDKRKEAVEVYRTDSEAHPGVAKVYAQGEWLIGGPVTLFARPPHDDFLEFRLDPEETRALFRDKGWRRVVGFQTRNPIHRAHEYIQKCALEVTDGLLVHPLVGETTPGWGTTTAPSTPSTSSTSSSRGSWASPPCSSTTRSGARRARAWPATRPAPTTARTT